MDDLYQQQILEHYKNPHNFGKLKEPDAIISEGNASCGDLFVFSLKTTFNDQGVKVVDDIKFTGSGCAISTAAASMVTDHIKGMPLNSIQQLTLESLEALIGTKVNPGRIKCLTLCLKGISKAVIAASQNL